MDIVLKGELLQQEMLVSCGMGLLCSTGAVVDTRAGILRFNSNQLLC